jgi:lysozyme family protein
MADVAAAVDFILKQEDAAMSGIITGSPNDRGGRTRFGIPEKWHPTLTATGFFDGMEREAALVVAEGILSQQYASPLLLAKISSQAIATALLSMAVVEGKTQAITLLQRAAGCADDGTMGPQTLAKVNGENPHSMMDQFALYQRAYFQRLAANDPTQLKWVHGWLNRMNAVQALA